MSELLGACIDALYYGRHDLTVVVVLGIEVVDELSAVRLLEEVGHALCHYRHGISLGEQSGSPHGEDGQERGVARALGIDVHILQSRLLTAEVEDEAGFG